MSNEYAKVEVRKPGDECVMHVQSVFFNPKSATHKYPDFTFKGLDRNGQKVMLYMPENACRRQFGRSPLTIEPEAAVGATIRFFRDENPEDATKPYWSVEMLSKGEVSPAPSKRLASPTTVPGEGPKPQQPVHDRWKDVPASEAPPAEDYPVRASTGQAGGKARSWDALVQQMGTAYAAAVDIQGDRGSADSYQAMCATFVIQADKQGVTIPSVTRQQVTDALDLEPFGD